MRPPKPVTNPGLAALIAGAGFGSRDRFAQAVNRRGWQMHGVKLDYDHISVKRWLAGSVCQNPDVVAAVLSQAWGIPIPTSVIWPELREGAGPVPAHLAAWAAARTLEGLAAFIGSDMLTRRETLTDAVSVVTGPALTDPLTRWLGVGGAVGLPAPAEGVRRIGMGEVEGIERATKQFAAVDADVGGGLSREAAVGQLKYAVDLLRYSSYGDATGNRLLAAVAGLSGLVGWMCHDSGMPGPAQRYLLYGLQAAKESTDPRAQLLTVRILADMGILTRLTGQHHPTAVRLIELAVSQLPQGRRRFNLERAWLSGQRAHALSYLGLSTLPEVRGAISLSFDLYEHASDDDRVVSGDLPHRLIPASQALLSANAACPYLVLATEDRRLAGDAAERTLYSMAHSPEGQRRNQTLDYIRLARTRFVAGEPDQGCDDGDQALASAEALTSAMVSERLRELYADTEPYRDRPRVSELRERLHPVMRG